jgi:hypothetical protein
VGVEIVHTQEQSYATGELLANRSFLRRSVGLS